MFASWLLSSSFPRTTPAPTLPFSNYSKLTLRLHGPCHFSLTCVTSPCPESLLHVLCHFPMSCITSPCPVSLCHLSMTWVTCPWPVPLLHVLSHLSISFVTFLLCSCLSIWFSYITFLYLSHSFELRIYHQSSTSASPQPLLSVTVEVVGSFLFQHKTLFETNFLKLTPKKKCL